MAVIESSGDTVVSTASSDEDASETSVSEDDDNINNVSNSQCSPRSSFDSRIPFSLCNNVLKVDTTFEYLLDHFKHSLLMNGKPLNLEKIVTNVCTCFS